MWYILVAAETGLVCRANWYQKLIPLSDTSGLVSETGTRNLGIKLVPETGVRLP